MKRILFITGALLIISLSLVAQEKNDDGEEKKLYTEALTQYQDENFEEASILFEKLISNGYSSYRLFYNAGNAAFKTGNIPAAILNYEKALLLKPFNEEIRYNLEIAKTYTVDNLEIIPEIFFIRWFKLFSLLLHSNAWAVISLVCFISTLTLAALFLFSSKYGIKKLSFTAAVIIIVFSILSFSLALTNKSQTTNNKEAIVFEPVVTGRSSPGTGGNELFVIHEGTKVFVIDKLGEWYEIKLSDGSVGWIPMDFVEKIIP